MSGSAVFYVDELGKAKPDLLHELAKGAIHLGGDEKVHMVWHQAKGMDQAVVAWGAFFQKIEVVLVVFFFKENSLAVVSPVNNVVRIISSNDPGLAWHRNL